MTPPSYRTNGYWIQHIEIQTGLVTDILVETISTSTEGGLVKEAGREKIIGITTARMIIYRLETK
jgi:hypothetical protein